MPSVEQPNYLKKSIRIFRFYGITFLFSIFTMSFLRSVNENFKIVYEALLALPFFIMLVLAPLGLYYSWKSHKAKEEPRKKRTMFFMGHLFFCILIVLFFMVIVKDLASLNW
ncbi:Uncharacterised protein [Sphingobacterium thalpophilum]|uniref:Uncharacterized protein n=1 Tax=Sphingobacterium thalpophilum TaxID=259 RepID=A0A4U9W1I1_9SPHI|nr:Uncharacterised protein [Sphingobacterium thalpophilum]